MIVAAMVPAALVVADRVAVIYAQHRVARRIGDEGFAAKPHVTIAGFPFLTQVATRRLTRIVVSATGKRRGPAEIKRLDITLSGVRVYAPGRASTAARISGTALVGFAGIAGMAGTPGLAIAADGPDRVKITIGVGRVSGTATARVSRAGPGGIRIAVISAGGIPVAALGSPRDITPPPARLLPGPARITIARRLPAS